MTEATNTQDTVEFAKLEVLNRLAEIEKGLEKVDPMIPVHMTHIHKTLAQYEELIHIIPEDQITTLMAGYQQWKKVKLTAEATEKRGPGARKKALNKTTVDDI